MGSNKDKSREYQLKRRYGITIAQYEELLKSQGSKCAVCFRKPEVFNKKLAVDHDHRTGEIYGLLCTNCNQYIIGRVRDPILFARASRFLQNGTGLFVPDLKELRTKRKRKKK